MVKLAFALLAFALVVGAVGVVGALTRDGDESGASGVEVALTEGSPRPGTVTIDRGETVTWVNEKRSDDAWPASDVHPTHELLPGFDARRGLAGGERWSYTFARAGRWTYHDHLAPENKGLVVVR